jgi:4-amino-4-deoxy-L-arabinose transferase-like glycosyltransferase
VRALSALLGTALVPVAGLCGRELLTRAGGLLTAALVALSPFMIWYGQEARPYMLLALLGALSLLGCLRARRSPGTRAIALWTGASALALLTHFFAGFLIAPEALALLWWRRDRAAAVAVAAVAAVQLALLPLVVSDTGHSLVAWIGTFPLHIRIDQIAVEFSLSTLYRNPIVTDGVLGAAVLAVVVGALLWLGAEPWRRRAAGLALVPAAVTIGVPLVLALAGADYVVPRNFIAAWVPLAIVLAAACTAPRTLPLGAALAALVLGAFVYAGLLIDARPEYQRPNWRGVAVALGHPAGARAIVADDGGTNAAPLAIYLPRVPWQAPLGPVRVDEVDVVGSTFQHPASHLPAGVRLLAARSVDDFAVDRFAVPGWTLTPAAIGARAATELLVPGPPVPAVYVQRAP